MENKVEIDVDSVVDDIKRKYFSGPGSRDDFRLSDLIQGNDGVYDEVINKIIGGAKNDAYLSDVANHFVRSLKDSYYLTSGTDYRNGQISRESLSSMGFENYIKVLEPKISGDGEIVVTVAVDYENDSRLKRQSVAPTLYPDGVENIIELLNYGYPLIRPRKKRKSISGMWHGRRIKTINKRKGAKFLDSAISYYTKYYAADDWAVDVKMREEES